jgi:hypothetical protein
MLLEFGFSRQTRGSLFWIFFQKFIYSPLLFREMRIFFAQVLANVINQPHSAPMSAGFSRHRLTSDRTDDGKMP